MGDQTFICRNPDCLTSEFIQSIPCPQCHRLASSSKATPLETPHAAIVLVLDGGGIRGLSTLFIEEALMKEVGNELNRQQNGTGHAKDSIHEPQCPSDYFTFMIGTSTGGIIATLQGIFGLDVPGCIKEYKNIGKKIFGRPRHLHVRQALFPRSKYDSDDFEEIISQFVDGQSDGHPNHPYFDYIKKFIRTRFNRVRQQIRPKDMVIVMGVEEEKKKEEEEQNEKRKFSRPDSVCKTAAVATRHREAGQISFIFRSYDHERKERHGKRDIRNPGKASGASIVEVVRATSAAPSYFKEKKIPSQRLHLEAQTLDAAREERFIDGGTAANNPSDLAWDEVCAWQMGVSGEVYTSASNAIGCIVSIGCGRTKWQMFANATDSAFRKYLRISLSLSKIVTDSGPSHRATRARARESHVPYFRFNVHKGLEETKLDEWNMKKRELDGQPLGNGKNMSTYDFIKEVTDCYLQGRSQKTEDEDDHPDVSVENEIKECAKLLVQYKLARDKSQSTQNEKSDPNRGPLVSTQQMDNYDDDSHGEDAILPNPK